jgi:ABC-2 type transport system permease protein
MFFDAFRAELYKAVRNKWTMLWAIAFWPALTLVAGIATSYLRGRTGGMVFQNADPLGGLIDGIGEPASALAQLLILMAAASLFAGEYRWQTWRNIAPRADRLMIMAAKVATFLVVLIIAMILNALSGVLVGVYRLVIMHSPLAEIRDDANIGAAIALAIGSTVLQTFLVASISLLVAVFTKSVMASAIAPFALMIALQIFTATRVNIMAPEWWYPALPTVAGMGMSAEIKGQQFGQTIPILPQYAAPGAIWMAAETALIGAIAFFRLHRQDFSEE